MDKILALPAFLIGLVFAPMSAQAHCDAVDGPVATAAVKSLDTRNVNLILPFAPAQAEPELSAALEQALAVRGKGPEAKTLADRYFMETAVRLHRAGDPDQRATAPAVLRVHRQEQLGFLHHAVGIEGG